MNTLGWIIVGGLLMSAIALVGSVTLLVKPTTLERLLLPLVAFSAGSLIGGAFFHMLPATIAIIDYPLGISIAVVIGALRYSGFKRILENLRYVSRENTS